jgi:hypothetical protein
MESNYERGQNLAYQELGRFLANFEHTAHTFRDNIALILKDNGLENETYSDILLNKLTAEPIVGIFQAMIPYYFENEMQKLFDLVIKEFRNLVELRNIIIHCYWIFGVGVDNEEISMIGLKQKNSKSGIAHYNLNMEIMEMKKLNEVSENFSELCHTIANKLKRYEQNFEQIISDLNNIKFKPFVDHFNKTP